jgi:CRP/FNR family cyclic AMP-dependent transcriptional regulator
MYELLRQAELVQGMSADQVRRLAVLGHLRNLPEGEYLFLLGDAAQDLCVVVAGQMNLCFPIRIGGVTKNLTVESVGAGKTVGWSALVKPYRFTLSARATEPTDVVAFPRQDLLHLFDSDPGIGCVLLSRVSELVGGRLSSFQALWARELQRRLETPGLPPAG